MVPDVNSHYKRVAVLIQWALYINQYFEVCKQELRPLPSYNTIQKFNDDICLGLLITPLLRLQLFQWGNPA
jgi:hypothetical protein